MTRVDSAPEFGDIPPRLREFLLRISSATDAYEFRRSWIDALAVADSQRDVDSVLVTAGARLSAFDQHDRAGPSGLDRQWLRSAADEVVGGTASSRLRRLVADQLRDEIESCSADLEMIDRLAAESPALSHIIGKAPVEVANLRDLGRLLRRLQGTGILAILPSGRIDEILRLQARLSAQSERWASVPEWLRISRAELLQWADTGAEASGSLPMLVRRLIIETCPDVQFIHFPAEGGTALARWDGEIETLDGGLYVPSGRSFWELSTSSKSQTKALDDFTKRAGTIDPALRSEATFVQLIVRPWERASIFAEGARHAGFRDVRALTVDDLATWLEHAPATSLWFRELTGRPTVGAATSDQVWDRWLKSTRVPLGSEIILAGREQSLEALRSMVGSARLITIGGDLRIAELRPFLAAAWNELRQSSDGELPELVFVDRIEVLHDLSQAGTRIALAVSDVDLAQQIGPENQQVAFALLPTSDLADIQVPHVDSEIVSKELQSVGLPPDEAADLGALARRSLLALRRRLAAQPELFRPRWAASTPGLDVRRALLVGAWNQRSSADRALLKKVFDTGDDLVSRLLPLAADPYDDPFIAVLDERWAVISPSDAWILLGRHVTPADLERLRVIAADVLLDPDPFFGRPEAERWAAQLRGAAPSRPTPDLRRGVARTLAILGSFDLRFATTSVKGAAFAHAVVSELLDRATSRGSFDSWEALAPYLPLLTEAAPRSVLGGLSALLSRPFAAENIFTDHGAGLSGSANPSMHTHLLWALERLMYSEDHFSDAFDLLVQLAAVDPGGGWSNRPLASLEGIFTPWRPDTVASSAARIGMLRRLATVNPDLAFRIALSMLPDNFASKIVQPGATYRDWKPSQTPVSQTEHDQQVSVAVTIASNLCVADPIRFTELVARLGGLRPSDRAGIVDALESVAARDSDSPEVREKIWSALRDLVTKHREFSTAPWAMSEQELKDLEPLVARLEPATGDRFLYLFQEDLPGLQGVAPHENLEAYDAELARQRASAVRSIRDAAGLKGVLEFSRRVRLPHQVGVALGRLDTSEWDHDLRAFLESKDAGLRALAFAYFAARFEGRSVDEITLHFQGATPTQIARLLLATNQPLAAGLLADKLGARIADTYWREFRYFGLGRLEGPELVLLANRMRSVGRNAAVLDMLALYGRGRVSNDYAEQVALAFEGLVANDRPEEEVQLSRHDISILTAIMAAHVDHLGASRVAGIEWHLVPTLGLEPKLPVLHRALAEDPALFVGLVELVYRPDNEQLGRPRSDADGQRRLAAYSALNSWRICPGLGKDGSIDEEQLVAWISTATELLRDVHRLQPGERHIGQVLASVGNDQDGSWPRVEIRNILERLQAKRVEEGMVVGVLNSRGVTTRGLTEGGRQEWQLVARHEQQANALRDEWPRSASVHASLADSYRKDAEREDVEAERWRQGYDR